MYLTKRRYRRTKKRVYKHKKTQKRQQTGGGLFNDIPLPDFIQTGYLEAKYGLEQYPADRWPPAFKINEPDREITVFLNDQSPKVVNVKNIFRHNIEEIKRVYGLFYNSFISQKKPLPRIPLKDYDKPIKSLLVRTLIEPVKYFDLKTTSEILSTADFKEVIEYISSDQIYSKSYGEKTERNNKFLLFPGCLSLLINSRPEFKVNGIIMQPVKYESEIDKKDIIFGIKEIQKSIFNDSVEKLKSTFKGVPFAGTLISAGMSKLPKPETSIYSYTDERIKKIKSKCNSLPPTSDISRLLSVPMAAFEAIPAAKPAAATAAKPAAATAAKPPGQPVPAANTAGQPAPPAASAAKTAPPAASAAKTVIPAP
jgi:hypothetical protein